MRYGVQYQSISGHIDAGTVRRQGDREVFITKEDVTGQVIGATALWLLAHDDGIPYQITDTNGVTYELTCRVVTGSDRIGFE